MYEVYNYNRSENEKFNDIVDGVRHLKKILFIYLQDFSPAPENWHAMSMKF